MSKTTIGSMEDQDFLTDLDIVARKSPGYGQAFSRIMKRGGFTQNALAESLNVDRSTISCWIHEKKWPQPERLRKALILMRVDRKALLGVFGIMLEVDTVGEESGEHQDANNVAVTLGDKLLLEADPGERESIIFDTIYEKMMLRQGLKGLDGDTRAAEFFAKRRDAHVQRQRDTRSKANPKGNAYYMKLLKKGAAGDPEPPLSDNGTEAGKSQDDRQPAIPSGQESSGRRW